MAYAVPDLTTFNFTDPSVERFAKSMVSTIVSNQDIIVDFAKSLIDGPFKALEYSLSVKLAAVRQRQAQDALEVVLDTMLHGDDKTWAYIKAELQQSLTYHVVFAASNPSRSTSSETNEMARMDLQAKAEMLDRLTKGRF